jgi:hypothetical protein
MGDVRIWAKARASLSVRARARYGIGHEIWLGLGSGLGRRMPSGIPPLRERHECSYHINP